MGGCAFEHPPQERYNVDKSRIEHELEGLKFQLSEARAQALRVEGAIQALEQLLALEERSEDDPEPPQEN